MAPQAVSRDSAANVKGSTSAVAGIDSRDLALALLCAALALWSYRWALGSYFSPDDLILIERARGLAATPHSLWRVLSGPLWFATVVPLLGANAIAYLAINWLLHAAVVVLIYAFTRRAGGSIPSATIAAALFASSRLFLSVVGQAVGIGDLLALGLTLAAAIALTRSDPVHRLTASVLFALALLAKESVAALPLALLLVPEAGRDLRQRLMRIAPLLVASAAWTGYLVFSGAFATTLGGPAYESSFGIQILRSLGTYAGWIVDFVNPAPDFSRPASDFGLIASVAGLAIVAILALIARKSAPLAPFGLTWFVLGIAPMLPLVHQRHLHYLYAPCAGLAVGVGAGLGGLIQSVTQRGAARQEALLTTLTVALLLTHTVASDRLMSKRVRDELWDEGVPYDPFVRKVELIRRMSKRVAPLVTEPGSRLVIIVPRIDDRLAELFRGLLPGVVDQGRGLCALYPTLDSVAFVDRWTPAWRDFQLVAGSVDGNIVAFGTGADSHIRFAGALIENGFVAEARQHLADAAPAYPDDSRLAFAEQKLRRSIAAAAQPMPQSSSRPSSPPMR